MEFSLKLISKPAPEPSLCSQCKRVPFESWFFPKSWKDLEFQLGMHELEVVRANRNSCSFCRLLLAALSSDPGFESVTWERSAFVHFQPHPFGAVQIQGETKLIARMNVQLIVDTNTWSTKRNGTIFGHGIQLAAGENDGENDSGLDSNSMKHLLKGRKLRLPDRVDPELLRRWLSICETTHHGGCVPGPFVLNDHLRTSHFRCIDVQARCVREMDLATCRYVALSYVWGDAVQFKLGKDTAGRLFSPGGLSDTCLDIPQTIRDAMLVTFDLNERYLWVDALCILQDDDEDRRCQIASMDKVYGSSVLTIVATGSSSADSPLAGVRPKSRKIAQHGEKVGDLYLMTTQRPFMASTEHTIYETRGWTFQEKILSRRLLVFTASQCFYQCNKAIFYEDAYLEPSDPTVVIDTTPHEGMNLRLYRVKPNLQADFTSLYSTLVEGYTRRVLREDSDGENAFAGIFAMLAELHSQNIGRRHWGLPQSIFGKALTWRWHNHFPERRRRLFPSWSWLGWRGDLDIRDNFSAFVGKPDNLREVVVFWSPEEDRLSFPAEETTSWRPPNAPTGLPTEARLLPQFTKEAHLICFYTSVATLHIDRTGKELESRHGCDQLHIRARPDAEPIGLVYLNREWRASRPDTMDFIVLCEYRAPPNKSKWAMDSGLVVILVESMGKIRGVDIKERVQVVNTLIPEKDWMAAGVRWDFVTLG